MLTTEGSEVSSEDEATNGGSLWIENAKEKGPAKGNMKGSMKQNSKFDRLSWSGDKFHDVDFPSDASLWRKVFLRGLQMRRNICNGRFELWRLFLTDELHMPVKKMTANTTFRELR